MIGYLLEDFGPINPSLSRPLDVHRWSDHIEITQLVRGVFNLLTTDEKLRIESKSNNKGRASGYTHLKIVLLDLFVAWKTDPELSIGVARGNDAYKVKSRYNALFISPRIRDVIDLLADHDLIDKIGGSYNRQVNGIGNRTSRIRASSKLRSMFKSTSIESYDLSLHHNQECILLTDQDIDAEGEPIAKKRLFLEYEDTKEILKMRCDLQQYNELLSRTFIDIPTLEEPYVSRRLSNGKSQKVPIDQTRKFVRRIFSRGDWKMNGRFYGGFWQHIEKDLRKKIYINDVSTIEVDYKGLHAAILNARGGIRNTGDIYSIKKLVLPTFNDTEQRSIIKLLVLTAINAKSKKSAFAAFRYSQPNGSREKKLIDIQLNQYLEAFLEVNPSLEASLCSDKGIGLMYTDSQITSVIINKFTAMGKPILSVHDSYIIGSEEVGLLVDAMKEATIEVVGVNLEAKQDRISYSQLLPFRQHDRDYYLKMVLNLPGNDEKTTQYKERLQRFMLSKNSSTI